MHTREISARQRRITVLLAFVGNVVPLALVTLDDVGTHPGVFFVGVAVAAAAPLGVTLTPRSVKPVRWMFAFSGLIGLTMLQAYSGGVSSPYAVLVAPLLQLASTHQCVQDDLLAARETATTLQQKAALRAQLSAFDQLLSVGVPACAPFAYWDASLLQLPVVCLQAALCLYSLTATGPANAPPLPTPSASALRWLNDGHWSSIQVASPWVQGSGFRVQGCNLRV